jgi:flagellin-like protein
MKIKMFKKAVSPLIATILLIAFAVALGAVVMNWGRGYVEDTADFAKQRSDQEMKCTTDVGIDFVEIGGEDQICYNATLDGDQLVFETVLENTKRTDIRGLRIRVIGNESKIPLTIEEDDFQILEGESKFLVFNYTNDTYGYPEQIKITPRVLVSGEEISCSNVGVEIEEVEVCE